MERWVTLLCQANAAPASPPYGEMAAMRKKLAELRRKLAQRGDRSCSPHMKGTPAVTYSQNAPLALGDRANPQGQGKGQVFDCIKPKAGDADLWIKIWEELHLLAARHMVVEVEHVKAHRTRKEKREMSSFDKIRY